MSAAIVHHMTLAFATVGFYMNYSRPISLGMALFCRIVFTVLAFVLPVVLPVSAGVAPKQATSSDSLRGSYFAHDLFEVFSDRQELGRGFRVFNSNGLLGRLFTYPASRALRYEIRGDGTFRLFSDTFDGGFVGSIGLDGQLAVYSLEQAPNADPQVRDGYASLQISVKQGSGMGDADFAGDYSYHAFLRTASGAYQTSFGVAVTLGTGSYALIREAATARTFSYDVNADGRMELGRQNVGNAALVAGGDLVVNTADVGNGDDGEIPEGYRGLALYLRRFPNNDATTTDFRGTYRVHRISANGTVTPRSDLGTVTAGGKGYFFGTLDGQTYGGQISLNTTGTFTLMGSNAFQGTLGAAGDVAVITSVNTTIPSLEIWVRTAGGPGNSLDRDGDGLSDAEEIGLGTDPGLADTDGDGLLDNADARPTLADNVVVATLSRDRIALLEGDPLNTDITLMIDSNNFPFFEWTLRSSVSWLTLDQDGGFGDGSIGLRIDPSTLDSNGSPWRAELSIEAPAMRAVLPLVLMVEITASQVDLTVAPDTLELTVAEGGESLRQSIAIASPDGDDFTWRVNETPAWLSVSPESGTGSGDVTLDVDPTTLRAAESPYSATVTFVPEGAGPKQATVALTVNVVPPRDLDVPFPLSPAEVTQRRPAVAFDSTLKLWSCAWVEEGQVWAMFFDENLLPRTVPVQLSITALGEATNPAVLVITAAQEAWVVWEQRATETSDGFIQARFFDLTDLSLGSGFGFTTGAGDKSLPVMAYNSTANEVVVTYNQEFNGESFVGFARLDGTTREERATGFAAASNNHQSRPAVAWLEDVNAYLIVWREIVTSDGTTSVQVRAARIDGASGNLLDTALVLDGDAPNAEHLRVVAATGLNRWVVAWSETALTSLPARVQTLSVTGSGEIATLYTADEMQQADTPIEMAYNEESKLLTLLWSRSSGAVYQHLAGTGQPLGGITGLPDNTRPASSAAVGANPTANEFLLVWEDPATIPRQLRALRIGGGSDDIDGDGLPNNWELSFGLDPGSPEADDGAAGDPDRDGLNNLAEFLLGTDPTDPDGDDDGLLDGQEDTNSDGILEGRETSPLNPDTDDDGVTDDVEWFLGSDGTDGESTPETGIYRVDYGTWTVGEAGTLTASLYIATSGSYALQVEAEAEGWTLSSEDNGAFRTLEAGAYSIDYTITPTTALTSTTAYATFRFVFRDADGVVDSRTTVLVADLLETYEGNNDLSAASLARAYAPVLRLHRDAVFSPIPVEISLGTATLDLGNTMTLGGAPAPIDLNQSPYVEAFVDLPGEDTEALFNAYPQPEDRPAPVAYYTVASLGDSSELTGANPRHIVIQYYFYFYGDVWGLDQTGGHRHEGDWEAFQVLLDEVGLPYQATTSQHWQLANVDPTVSGGESRSWEEIERIAGDRPVVYVAKGSHALYFEPGATAYESGADVHDGTGYWMLPENEGVPLFNPDYRLTMKMELSPLRRLNETDPTRWLRFAGGWGQPNYPIPETDSANPPVNDGPVGPAFMGTTLDQSSGAGVERIWSDPFLFAERMPNHYRAEELSEVRGRLPEALWGKTLVLLGTRGRLYRSEISMEDGSFVLSVPVQCYTLAVVSYDETELPSLLAVARFQLSNTETALFPAVVDLTELGELRLENAVLVGSANYPVLDSDGDGTVDSEDSDIDNDGIANRKDDDVLGDGWADVYQAQDPDEDGIPSFLDDDDDGDGIPDATDSDRDGNGVVDADDPGDIDQDGFFDVVDFDQDNDGYDDLREAVAGSDPRHYLDTPISKVGDLDQDGAVDAVDGQQLVNQGLGRAPYNPRADYNLNGVIDAVDLQLLVNDILASLD